MTPDPKQLLDMLDYKRQVLEQFLTVGSIFGGFAVTGVVAMRTESHRDRIHALAFAFMALASIAFIFATALNAIWLPVSHLQKVRTAPAIQAVLDTGECVVWAILIGAVCLISAVGMFGFSRSRRMGFLVLGATLAAAVVYIWNIRALILAT